MKVILSVEPVRFPLTGIGRYAYELARGMQNNRDVTELKLFSGTRFLPSLPLLLSQFDGTLMSTSLSVRPLGAVTGSWSE